MHRPTDQELLVSARTDADAFGLFYDRHVRAVYGYFRRRAGSVESAFDLTAETFAAALQSVGRYEPRPEPARAWLFAIAHNVMSESRRHGVADDKARRALEMQPIVLDDEEAELLERDQAHTALAALDELPTEQREAVRARHIDELEYAEIAQRVRCSESVVRQRVSRGLRVLRTRLQGAPSD
ncbi:MAG TPA: RNA polymerase sigma factor [Solirubrobacteraceae bacterium]|jgi:RNA polymerase sigma-70 factor (ECF subfamily)|nr:RNA polymerase sigma factor [Solirubrobacteraceae bacterium]